LPQRNSGTEVVSILSKDFRGRVVRPNSDEPRKNEQIRIPEIRVINDAGEPLGIMHPREALAMAREKGLDLVEISPTAQPPVCKIMDYGKFKYLQKKKQHEAKMHQHQTETKEVKLRPKIADHDYQVKLHAAERFLNEKDKVKVTIMFSGREMQHQEFGHRLLQRMTEDLKEISTVEYQPKLEGRNLFMILTPSGKAGQVKKPAAAPKADAKAEAPKGDAKGEPKKG